MKPSRTISRTTNPHAAADKHNAPENPCALPLATPVVRIRQSIRQIIRAVDQQSKYLQSAFGITGPQLVCLSAICEGGSVCQRELARQIHVGTSTITGIIDRLEARQLVERVRGSVDRRRLFVHATEQGRKFNATLPSYLHNQLAEGLERLPQQRQSELAEAMQTIVRLLGAEDPDASSVIANGALTEAVDIHKPPSAQR